MKVTVLIFCFYLTKETLGSKKSICVIYTVIISMIDIYDLFPVVALEISVDPICYLSHHLNRSRYQGRQSNSDLSLHHRPINTFLTPKWSLHQLPTRSVFSQHLFWPRQPVFIHKLSNISQLSDVQIVGQTASQSSRSLLSLTGVLLS